MGNHRRYSKGCKTCVQRKVKCDGSHPRCGRCHKAGISCQGFQEATFVDAREQVMTRFACGSKPVSSPRTSAESSGKVSSRQLDVAVNDIMTSVIRWQDGQPIRFSGYVLKSPSSLPFRDEMYVLYTVENMCKGPLAVMYRSVFPCNTSGLQPHQTMMSQCLLALAKVFYGFKNGESRVLRDGMCLYGRGLGMLNDVLGKDNCSVTTEIIVCVHSLCACESIMPTSKSSWMIHILGLERLFALQRLVMTENTTILDRGVLESCRPLMILGAFFTQRPSLMAKPEWKVTTQPQRADGSLHLCHNSIAVADWAFLMGILAELPALFLQCNDCIRLARTKSSTPPPAHVAMIWTKLRQLQCGLTAWQERWHDNYGSLVFETLRITTVDSTQIVAWKTVFYFSSVELAVTFTMYHSVVILLTGIPISLVEVGLLPPNSSVSSTPGCDICSFRQSLLSDVKSSIRSICRSIEYYLQFLPASQAPADFYLFFPVHVARRASIQLGHSSELAWLADASEVMESRYPMGVWANMDFGDRFSGFREGLFG